MSPSPPFEHGPIDQSLVLGGKTAPAPGAKVRRILSSLGSVFGVHGKESAVELGGPLTAGIAAQLIAEELIIASQGPGLAIRLPAIDLDKAALPELLPPGEGWLAVIEAVFINGREVHQIFLPLRRGSRFDPHGHKRPRDGTRPPACS